MNQSINPRFVIVSTGRSGSGYIAKLLTMAGIPTGHEKRWNKYEKPGIDNFGKPGSQVQLGESSWYSLPYIEQGFSGPIFHQVRNPLNVLSSLMNKELQIIKPPLAYNYRRITLKHG